MLHGAGSPSSLSGRSVLARLAGQGAERRQPDRVDEFRYPPSGGTSRKREPQTFLEHTYTDLADQPLDLKNSQMVCPVTSG